MQGLSEMENSALGACAAFVEAVALQPTLFWKNQRMQGLPMRWDIRVVYRGMGAALCNEMGQMGMQFGMTGYVKKLIVGDEDRKMRPAEEIQAAFIGGGICGIFVTPVELVMIQQQRYGGSVMQVSTGLARNHGAMGLMRGLAPTLLRDGVYVSGLLGFTPVLQDFMVTQGVGLTASGLYSSLLAGVLTGIASCPLDTIKTCMAGDVKQENFKGFRHTTQALLMQGGVKRLFAGVMWRTINITGTVYLANECRVRLAPVMFPHATFYHETA